MTIEVTQTDQAAVTSGRTDTMVLVMVCLLALIGLAGLVTMTG
jgi:hypothetical protein